MCRDLFMSCGEVATTTEKFNRGRQKALTEAVFATAMVERS